MINHVYVLNMYTQDATLGTLSLNSNPEVPERRMNPNIIKYV